MSYETNESAMEEVLEQLKCHTILRCYDCEHAMIYDTFKYQCKSCYNTVEEQDVHPDDIFITDSVINPDDTIISDITIIKTIVESYENPRELIEQFISVVLKRDVTEEKVEQIMDDLGLNSGYVLK